LSDLCDYFVICSGDNEQHVQAIYDEARRIAHQEKIAINHCEDDPQRQWLLVDYSDVILHVLSAEARSFYNLEHLWAQGKRVRYTKRKK